MTTIEPRKPHRCHQPTDMGTATIDVPDHWGGGELPFRRPVEHGTLWRCPQCRRWWVAGPHPDNGRGVWFGGGGLHWRRVHWWNINLRWRITRWESAHTYRGPGTYYCSPTTPKVATVPLESPPPLT